MLERPTILTRDQLQSAVAKSVETTVQEQQQASFDIFTPFPQEPFVLGMFPTEPILY